MRFIVLSLFATSFLPISQCKKAPVPISAKSMQLFGKTWTYDTEKTRSEVMQKAHDSLGGAIHNIKDIKLLGDVKKMADAVASQTITFYPDKDGRGVAFLLTEGKGLLTQKTQGLLSWNADETGFTLTPDSGNRKPLVYTLKELSANRLVILPANTATETPETFVR